MPPPRANASPPTLQVRLFGGLTLAWDEVPLPSIPGTVARSLLAFLLTYRDRPHTRDLLAGTFWPDLPAAPPLGDQTKTPPSER